MCAVSGTVTECEVGNMVMKRTISGMVGSGSLAHNRRSFVAENVDLERVHLNIKYCDENLKTVYHELFDESVERYNEGKRNDRKIIDYYEKIQHGKQEKLFHEVIFQIGNKDNMAANSDNGELAAKILDEYMKNFQERNPTLRVFNCYLHLDEATPHLHIDFVPYVQGWKGKGMDTRVSLKQALKSLGFQGGSKQDSELNQWINHEKTVLAKVMERHGIEWEQKGTHEEHLGVYDFKKKVRMEEVKALEQENALLTAENEGLAGKVEEYKAELSLLGQEKTDAEQVVKQASERAEKAEKELSHLEKQRDQLKPIIDNVNKELKDYGKVDLLLPEAGALERAGTYRDKKAKPIFVKMKNTIAALAAQVVELASELKNFKSKYKQLRKEYNALEKEADQVADISNQLLEENERLQNISDRYDRVVRVLGKNTVDLAIQTDIRREKELEQKRLEQMPQGSLSERLKWAESKRDEYNVQRKKNKVKNREMEI